MLCLCVLQLLPAPLQTLPLHVPVVMGGGAGCREDDSLLLRFSLPPEHETLQVGAARVMGIRPPCPLLLLVQMPKLCCCGVRTFGNQLKRAFCG